MIAAAQGPPARGLGELEDHHGPPGLPATVESRVLLCTDLHAGNVLAAQREPCLVINPKPFPVAGAASIRLCLALMIWLRDARTVWAMWPSWETRH